MGNLASVRKTNDARNSAGRSTDASVSLTIAFCFTDIVPSLTHNPFEVELTIGINGAGWLVLGGVVLCTLDGWALEFGGFEFDGFTGCATVVFWISDALTNDLYSNLMRTAICMNRCM